MKKENEIEELIKDLNKGKVFDDKTRDLDKFLLRLSKKLIKARVINTILVFSEQKNTLGAEGILITRLEEKLRGINKRFIRSILGVLEQKNLIKFISNPYGSNRKKKVIVKGEHQHLNYFREELEKIIKK